MLALTIACISLFFTDFANAQNVASKPSVDVESLGLDKKDDAKVEAVKAAISSNVSATLLQTSQQNTIQNKAVNPSVAKSADSKVAQTKVNKANAKTTAKKPRSKKRYKTTKKILAKNSRLRDRLKQEKKRALASKSNEIDDQKVNGKDSENIATDKKEREKQRAKKINDLRKAYVESLQDDATDISENNEDEFGNPIIVPKKKDLNPFVIYNDNVPPHLRSRDRASANKHIPQYIDEYDIITTMFKAISVDDIGGFNDAANKIADMNVKNEKGDTLLTYAILLQKPIFVTSILSKNADVDLPNNLGYRPLEIAIELLDSSMVKLLIKNSADVHYKDAMNNTYLMHAVRVGSLPIVQMLIDKKIDINAVDNDGMSALSLAYRYKKNIIAKYLLKHNAELGVRKPYEYDLGNQSMIDELKNRWKKSY